MRRGTREALQAVQDVLLTLRSGIPGLGHPLQRGEPYRPFFIVGSGRSGNTVLRRMLCAHGDLHIPPETYVLGDVIRVFRRHRGLLWRDLVPLVLGKFEFYPEFATFDVSLRPLANRLLGLPRQERSLARLLDEFYRFHAESRGFTGRRWGDKTPLNTFHLDKIRSVFPAAQFIHLLRDGCDVAHSYVSAGLCPDLAAAGRRWRDSVEAVQSFSDRHASSCLEIRYEELVRAPRQQLDVICRFLEVDVRTEMLASEAIAGLMGDVAARPHHERVGEPLSAASVGKGRRALPLAERRALEPIIGATLARLGYDPCASADER
ncbi:MAG: sulfotransferase [Planctomycetia bacterium]|nr:sulfotransferase [Planctomycetia bacterium]